MSDRKLSPLIIGFIGALVVINVFGIAKSFEALSLAREAQVSAATLSALQEQMERMRSELSDMTKKLAQGPAQFGRPAGPPPSFAGVHPGFPPGSTADLALMNRPARANSPQQAGNTPAQPSGPQKKVAPQVLASHRKDLIERITNYHQEDAARYGDKITEYYDAARRDRGPSGSNMESDQAFSQLLSEYPDAHATGMVIAEKAIEAAGQANTVAVEQLYSLLQERQDYSSIVTDSGMEAVPAIQAYLALFVLVLVGVTLGLELPLPLSLALIVVVDLIYWQGARWLFLQQQLLVPLLGPLSGSLLSWAR